jgi:hypothetical protein
MCWLFPYFSHFGPSTSDPEMVFFRSFVGHGLLHMWDSVPICPLPSPSLPYSSSLFEVGCLLSFQPNPGIQIMSEIPSQPGPVPHRQHWTVPVSREEMLAAREKFQHVGWRPPTHKPKTKKITTWAKGLWDSYLTPGDLQVASGYV